MFPVFLKVFFIDYCPNLVAIQIVQYVQFKSCLSALNCLLSFSLALFYSLYLYSLFVPLLQARGYYKSN